MNLLCYQKAFKMTHNDLHTNNIMFINTDKQFLYYNYNNLLYKVPTFGKIYKIIDFLVEVFLLLKERYLQVILLIKMKMLIHNITVSLFLMIN